MLDSPTLVQGQRLKKKVYASETMVPRSSSKPADPGRRRAIAAGAEQWRYKPTVGRSCKSSATGRRQSEENIQLIPVPDSRQYGNTQGIEDALGVYKLRLGASGQQAAKLRPRYLPDGAEGEGKLGRETLVAQLFTDSRRKS